MGVDGERYFVKVQVQPRLFIDVLVFVLPSSAQPKLEGMKIGVDVEAPIDDFQELAITPVASPEEPRKHQRPHHHHKHHHTNKSTEKQGWGSKSKEQLPDSELLDLFKSNGKMLQKQAEDMALAQ